MANGVVLDSQLDEYRRCLKASKRWWNSPIMSLVLLIPAMALAVLVKNIFFGGSVEDDPLLTSLVMAAVGTIPVAIFLFWSNSVFDRVERLGTKLVIDFLGEGWLPSEAKLDSYNGKVMVTLKGGQKLNSTVEEVVVGRGRWVTSKHVALQFGEAVEWYEQDPPPVTGTI